jgi:hydroxybutyrate-dimer hydrolase
VRFAFFVLNERFGRSGPDGSKRVTIHRDNTIVIASGISNGGTGALQAAEQDLSGLIDGVAITEPNAQPRDLRGLRIIQGSEEQPTIGKPLYDYFTFANLYRPCAALALTAAETAGYVIVNALAPSVIAAGPTRCQSLKEKGLVNGATTAEQPRMRLPSSGAMAGSRTAIRYSSRITRWRRRRLR